MRTAVGLLFFIIPTFLAVAYAQNTSVRTANKNSSAKMPTFANPGWTEDELIFSRVISTRAEKLEEKTGFHFDKNWTPKVSLEWNLGAGAVGFDGLYKAETQTTYFPIRILYELTARQKQSSSSLNADTAAADAEFAELLDHELGHVLMDQVSRRNGLGPWFTENRFSASTKEERMGLDILSEGTAVFFQSVYFPRDHNELSERTFPPTLEQRSFYTYRMIAYDGGFWIVRDVLHIYGERGLLWFMRHPFLATDNMRAAAVNYLNRAFEELSHAFPDISQR